MPLHRGRRSYSPFSGRPAARLSPCVSRAVKFFAFCHPELAKDLPPQREILAGDASLPLSMTERLFIMAEWFPEVTKATKGQKIENLTAMLCKGESEGVVEGYFAFRITSSFLPGKYIVNLNLIMGYFTPWGDYWLTNRRLLGGFAHLSPTVRPLLAHVLVKNMLF